MASLLRLPTELRLRIYHFVFADNEVRLVHNFLTLLMRLRSPPCHATLWRTNAEILGVTRLIRAEALSQFNVKLSVHARATSARLAA